MTQQQQAQQPGKQLTQLTRLHWTAQVGFILGLIALLSMILFFIFANNYHLPLGIIQQFCLITFDTSSLLALGFGLKADSIAKKELLERTQKFASIAIIIGSLLSPLALCSIVYSLVLIGYFLHFGIR